MDTKNQNIHPPDHAVIHVNATRREKGMWVKASRDDEKKLGVWIREIINAEIERKIEAGWEAPDSESEKSNG